MMKDEVDAKNQSCDAANKQHEQPLAQGDIAQLTDPVKQAEYRREYLAQLRQRSCPGCGESVDLF